MSLKERHMKIVYGSSPRVWRLNNAQVQKGLGGNLFSIDSDKGPEELAYTRRCHLSK